MKSLELEEVKRERVVSLITVKCTQGYPIKDIEGVKRRIIAYIENLAEIDRLILFMYYYEGMSAIEIGRVLDMKPSEIMFKHAKMMSEIKMHVREYVKYV